jgi:acetyl-CoA carboxylase carboxyl transferase subunit beta
VEERARRAPTSLADEGTFVPVDGELASRDPLGWNGYPDALKEAADGPSDESVIAGPALIGGYEVELALFDFSFFGGSMGEVAGERIARGLERAAARGVPFVLRTATGGARMQEGMRSLVQMPKVVAARIALRAAHVPFIAILGHPTTGGVLASVGALADVTVAESQATVGFAGPRVAEAFTGRPLTGISHTAERALISGLIDDVVETSEVRSCLERALRTFAPDEAAAAPDSLPETTQPRDRDAWEAVLAARSSERPLGFELLLEMAEAIVELRGDRQGEEDPSLDTAIARIEGRKVLVMALDRDRVPRPAAFRKARRCIEIASNLGIPVVTLVDTRGADPSEDSESTGIAWEIAKLFEALLTAPVPTLSIVTGEGGSGGALAFASTDTLAIFEDAIFSVIGPEMAAQILWRDKSRAAEASQRLRLTASELHRLGIADHVLPEPPNARTTCAFIAYHLARLEQDPISPAERVNRRLARWRDHDANR